MSLRAQTIDFQQHLPHLNSYYYLSSITSKICASPTCSSYDGWFYTDYGTYHVDTNTGCMGTSVPAMVDFCVDWDNRCAHFRFSGQGKRCMIQDSESAYGCASTCYKTTWREIPYNWRMASEEDPATEIVSSAFVAMMKTAGN
ncbi:hypothetical protein H9Q73_010933 [Fusarium xylarioides]|nr:hypothetical protein H9Q73_010933 [Fusarium xylarioides]